MISISETNNNEFYAHFQDTEPYLVLCIINLNHYIQFNFSFLTDFYGNLIREIILNTFLTHLYTLTP